MASIAPTQLSIEPQREKLKASTIEGAISLLVALGVAGAIIYGWLHRHEEWINPEHGFGYALGIIGGSMMIILLAYPVRKRVRRPSRAAGSIGFWFRFHMLLGLMGPLAILFHSRFSWGALNSAVALGAMLIVAGSGLVGRFFYSRVHRGYSGRKLEVRALKTEMNDLLASMEALGVNHAVVEENLLPFEERAVSAGSSFWSSAAAVLGLSFASRSRQRFFRKEVERAVQGQSRERLLELVDGFFEAVRRAAEFAFYDRLLRLWHMLHLPLFFLLVGTAIMHIVAVHMY